MVQLLVIDIKPKSNINYIIMDYLDVLTSKICDVHRYQNSNNGSIRDVFIIIAF